MITELAYLSSLEPNTLTPLQQERIRAIRSLIEANNDEPTICYYLYGTASQPPFADWKADYERTLFLSKQQFLTTVPFFEMVKKDMLKGKYKQ